MDFDLGISPNNRKCMRKKQIMLPGFSFTFCCEMKNLECEVGVVFRFRYKVALSVIN